MNKQYIKGAITKIDKEKGTFQVLISTADVDRDGEVIDVNGWDFTNFLKNPVILWAHNYSDLPIGVAEKIAMTEQGPVLNGRFASKEANPKAENVRLLYEEGIQKAVSVGFIPKERDPEDETRITLAELLEVSFVPVPANPNSLALAMKKGIKQDSFVFEQPEAKGPVASHEPPKAPMERDWDGDGARKRLQEWAGGPEKENIDFDKYATGFAWFDDELSENLTAYKLPHIDIVDGKFQVVWRGVIAAMGVLLGARGGIDIPEEDRRSVFNHLANHYEQFDREPPAFRSYTPEELKVLSRRRPATRTIRSAT